MSGVNPGGIAWGSDTEVSLPEPMTSDPLVDMGGFCFTIYGIAHHFTETDREVYLDPTFAPEGWGMAGEVPS